MLGGFSLELLAGAVGVVCVVALGKWLAKRQQVHPKLNR